ncbi:hypothetical protein M407DRAFT_70252 [Tulasnella calospora MUT 4182]|uniref:Uncharacterized protein n=1 Tax=Tulasnella calospora MUT 4182 TaxID=1051891 RepID=A0A0C3QEK1_9AGAM|nr:hypothetical protein M407DRAFT_70252 [Tulasnella calospora MUT 4182]
MTTLHGLVFAVWVIAVLLVIGEHLLWKRREKRRNPEGLPYPPGPRQLPFIGSVYNLLWCRVDVCAVSLLMI